MLERSAGSFFLLTRFAEFFEEVACIKLAIAEGRLSALLTVGDELPPVLPGDLAARVSGKLAGVLRAQWKDVTRNGTAGEIKAYRLALYAMAALADELFILEMDWTGRDSWLDVLLEFKLFQSRNAGVRFFDVAEQLLATRNRSDLHIDLAAVLVVALQLGFKGQYRGEQGEAILSDIRERLFRVVERNHGEHAQGHAFPQAWQQLLSRGEPARLAPLTPWYIAAGVALMVYVLISSALWFYLMEPFRQAVGRG
ncbi:MAG TPA: DotU family type IV/VI secretion system protein [Rhodocyclaceae bacterium]|nr:DotU family type IV/VI secretion system protein [Rhodocyclaceae bacterium]